MTTPVQWLRSSRSALLDDGRGGLAMRAAVAATLSWLVVLPLWGVADEYPYYAPFGAVIAVTGTVAVSARESARSVAAILTGSLVAVALAVAPLPQVLALALVAGVATLVAGLPWLRPVAGWVPVAGVFVLELGGSTPWEFATAYFGLTALGALVGIAVDLAWPALPMEQTDRTLRDLRGQLADQLDEMASTLEKESGPDPEDWARTRLPVVTRSLRADTTVAETAAARRGNWRARRWWEVPDRQRQRADDLQALALLVQDLRTMLERHEHRDVGVPALGPHLRGPAAEALRSVAVAVRTAALDGRDLTSHDEAVLDDDIEWGEDGGPGRAHRDALQRAVEAVDRLENAVRASRRDEGGDLFAAASAVTTLWRVVSTLTPPALRGSLVPGW